MFVSLLVVVTTLSIAAVGAWIGVLAKMIQNRRRDLPATEALRSSATVGGLVGGVVGSALAALLYAKITAVTALGTVAVALPVTQPERVASEAAASRYSVSPSSGGWDLEIKCVGRSHFKGRVVLKGDGDFGKVTALDATPDHGDSLLRVMKQSKQNKELVFDFVTAVRSGVHINVVGSGKLSWDLGVGGAEFNDNLPFPGDPRRSVNRSPADVLLGLSGEHPVAVPFTTTAAP